MITVEDVRAFVADFPRSYEVLVRDRIKWRVGQIVYVAFSHDEAVMGFGFPKEEREMLVDTYPGKFLLPRESDMRFNWVCARCEALGVGEMRELVYDAWRMVVPQKVSKMVQAPPSVLWKSAPDGIDPNRDDSPGAA